LGSGSWPDYPLLPLLATLRGEWELKDLLSYTGGIGRRIVVQSWPGQKSARPYLKNNKNKKKKKQKKKKKKKKKGLGP
jgi:hypothetical protein